MSTPPSRTPCGARGLVRVALTVMLAAVAGCAAVPPSGPPPYTGADRVRDVDRDVFVGDWRMVALNPKPGEQVPARTLSYANDGTFVAFIEPTEEMAKSMGPEPLRLRGRWRVERGRLVQRTEEVSVPGADRAVNELLAEMIGQGDPLSASAEVHEAGSRRIVIVSDEGYANALERD